MSGNHLSIERLQQLLQDDAKRRSEMESAERNHRLKYRHLSSIIRDVWSHVGVFPGHQEHWMRPAVQATLYQCPVSNPLTTLVPWNSLPGPIQWKLHEAVVTLPPGAKVLPDTHDNTPGIVEVPIELLSLVDDSRPIKGNLSDKLSEYTRGTTGLRKPHRPGGLEDEEILSKDFKDSAQTSEAAIARSLKVLEQGVEASWKDGSLIMAPPGVGFQVGLSWSDLGMETPEKSRAQRSPGDDSNMAMDNDTSITVEKSSAKPLVTGPPEKNVGIFNRAYFDDDSLFGSSSSSGGNESQEEDDDDDDEIEEHQVNDSVVKKTSVQLLDSLERRKTAYASTATGTDENIDELLEDLTISDEKLFRKRDDNVLTNPLDVLEKQSKHANDANRKSWASTKLLPIHDFNALIPNPAIEFPFTLDDFQQQAIARLERSESIFVAAHTSAGKTVVAEYAVALAKQRATRCIYTSPIKALSNQKFRDFCQKFGSENVGLVTGDLQVNVEDSTCLIMTTEILRSMLYRGADLIRDIEYVVFDEVHYVNDTERGVVWEEVIIMLPSNVNLIFLSATTPNTIEFSDWIGRTKRKLVHVIKTDYRPVPLSHFLWAGSKLHKVLQGNGSFIEKGFKEATDALVPSSAKDPMKKREQSGRTATGSKQLVWQAPGTKQNWMSLVRYLDREFLTPAVIFTFSKKKCEEVANMLRSLDLNTAKERNAVQAFAIQAVARLSHNDANLPQVLLIVEMVKRGIGIHHGGLLPILKEMVEILFSRNLIKVLFATETFAMGVNMPAKAVVFNSIRKHDGNQFRVLEPGEYTQMAGRAGRRGIDKVGTVIICCFGETPPPQQILRQMLTGSSTRLSSQFRLTYNMILNLLKVEEMSVESMIKRSFSEFATQRALAANEYPQLLTRGIRTLEKLDEQYRSNALTRIGADDIDDYYEVSNELLRTNYAIFSYILESDAASFDELFQTGRVVFLTAARQCGVVRSPALILRSPSTSFDFEVSSTKGASTNRDVFVCLVLLPSNYVKGRESDDLKSVGSIGYVGTARQRHFTIYETNLNQVVFISDEKRKKIDVKAILKDESPPGKCREGYDSGHGRNVMDQFAGFKALGGRKVEDEPVKVGRGIVKEDQTLEQAISHLIDAERAEVLEGGAKTVKLQSYVKRGNEVVQFRGLCDHADSLLLALRSLESHLHPNLESYYKTIERKEALRQKVKTLQHLLSNESLQLFPDFLQRKEVLRRLGYIDENDTVCVKGRVACEVNTCEELIATEMVFEGLLNDLDPEEIVAVLSALVYQEKNSDDDLLSDLPEKLVSCCQSLKTIATNLGRLQKECGLKIDPGEYCDNSMKFGLVNVVYEWALGVPFKNICDLTDAPEGSIVRCITRLDELCREVRNCARVVGNPTLYRKLEEASTAIKRDIVFASSLYVN